MADISATTVRDLRDKTGAGMMECKNALVESNGDLNQAVEYLRKRGLAKAAKRSGRETSEGAVHSYIHAGGKIGVLIEVNCETDFVAKTDDFINLVRELALHVAAANPLYLNADQVPAELIAKEREIFREQARASGKPEKVLDSIVDGKVKKFYTEICLLDQPFVKDPDKTVGNLIHEVAARLGENITVRRFCRYQLGISE